LYDSLQDWAAAQSWAREAANTYGQIDDQYGRARAQAIEAAALMEVALTLRSEPSNGRQRTSDALQQARDLLASVVSFHSKRGEAFDQALAQNNIGLAYYYGGRNDDAIGAYRGALTLFNRLGEERWKKIALQNMALADYELGRVTDAIAQYEQVLQLMTADDDPVVVASVLNNCAIANRVSGNLDVALHQYTSAMELERKSQNGREQARSLHGIGAVYETLGDRELALKIYKQALALLPVELDARGRTASLRSLGNVLRAQGNANEALALHREALSLASTRATRAQIQIQLARDLESLGRQPEAITELNSVIDDPFTGGEVVRAQARLERGQLSVLSGNFTAGESDLRSSIRTLQERDAPFDEFIAWVALAQLQRQRTSIERALESVNRALELAEEVRLQSANPELRAALLQPLRPGFDLKVSLLEQLYFDGPGRASEAEHQNIALRALVTSERARARALEDLERVDISAAGVDPQLLERRRMLYRELASRHFLLEARRDRFGDDDPKVEGIRVDIATLRAQLVETEAQINSAGGSAKRSTGKPTNLDLRRIPGDTAVVVYWLGSPDAIAWVLTRDHLEMIRLAPSAQVTEVAQAFYNALKGFGSIEPAVRLRESDRLSALVVQPIARQIAGKRKLIFAPDHVLHYIPFAALRTTEGNRPQFLVESHDISVTPSVRVLLDPDRRRQLRTAVDGLLLVADPVYSRDDDRFPPQLASRGAQPSDPGIWSRLFRGGSRGESLSRLAGTAREAALIESLLPQGQVELLEGFAATKNRFLSSRLEQYRLIHVASHGTSDAEIPGLSALILSTVGPDGREIDGRVLAADLSARRINADLVVLSACDTALGKNVAGEGLMGLQYILQARGARSVISSLWEVPDEAAAEAMGGFYRAYLGGPLPVGSALSEAMRQMLRGPFKDPSEWAAFSATVSDLGTLR
jgi:CHAT domain-containing protein/tetratricopeptide (TPR) repeat protein